MKTILPALAFLILAGCSFTGPTARPDLALPEQWAEAEPATRATARPTQDWWRAFAAPQLDALIADVLAGNPDLRVQGERVIQAELALRTANASLFPSLGLSGKSTWNRDDTGSRGGNVVSERKSSTLTLSASYELDLWGRVSASIASGEASLTASRHDYDGARLSLAANAATLWFQYLATAERLSIARENLSIAERVLKVVEARYRNGAVSALDLSRQETAVLSQRAKIDPLEVQMRQIRMALDILRGKPPGADAQPSAPALADIAIPAIDAGLPSELLLRRPDIASAEARLAAAAADIGAARAALFPSINLSASGGLTSNLLLSLASPASAISLSAAVVQTIFDGGRLRIQVDSARSRERELLETYRKTILAALKEVEDALSNTASNTRQEEAQARILAEAERSLRLAELRYREGADDLLSVLDAQRTRFAAQDQLAQFRLARLTDAVNLYKALGGGWND